MPKKEGSNYLPTARYVKVNCPRCNQAFWADQGKEQDRHEYLFSAQRDKTTCPLCGGEYEVPTNEWIYGIVRN